MHVDINENVIEQCTRYSLGEVLMMIDEDEDLTNPNLSKLCSIPTSQVMFSQEHDVQHDHSRRI